MKVTRKNESVPLLNSQFKCWTHWRKEWKRNKQYSFYRTLWFQRPIFKKKSTTSCLLDILLILLEFFLHFQLCQTNLNQSANLRYFHAIWSIESILGNNSRTKILPGIEFGMESQALHSSSFQRVLRKIKQVSNMKKKKKKKALFWGPFCPNIWAKVTFVQNYACQFLGEKMSLHEKKTEKALS